MDTEFIDFLVYKANLKPTAIPDDSPPLEIFLQIGPTTVKEWHLPDSVYGLGISNDKLHYYFTNSKGHTFCFTKEKYKTND